jgi:plastocyanin
MSNATLNRRVFLMRSALATGALATRVPAALATGGRRHMVFHGTGFAPMVAVVRRGEPLRIECARAHPLRLVSAPTAPRRIIRSIGPGETFALRLTEPGLYLFYDALTTRFDPRVGQVAARSGSPYFPMPAYAAVLVTDRAGGGVALTAPQVNIPDTTMTFQPWAVVCAAGTPVRFTNNDMDAHVVLPAPGARGSRPPFGGLPLPSHGGTGILRLERPGLYHYYCPLHAQYRAAADTFEPLPTFGGFPFVMDGLIAVMPPARA